MVTKIISGCLLMMAVANSVLAQVVRIPDENFKNAIIDQGVDTNGDGQIQVSEAQKVTELYVTKSNVTSLEGIKSFTNLVDFGFGENQVKACDVSGLKQLKFLYGFDNQLESINTKGCDNLVNISCHKNKLKRVEIAHLKKLAILSIGWNLVTKLDFSNNPEMEELEANDNQLREINVANCPKMVNLWVTRNQIDHHLDLRHMTNLVALRADFNQIPSVDIRGLSKLAVCFIDKNRITTLNLSGTVSLQKLMWHD
ncbi:hypothetical protein SAMN05444266_103153 [Chitinophaga jiangningensis]|uniref:Leucine Rich repeat-containing protein n=1 Tax=Chitinophaga jiangningensis TaxID=1419482 RepID=A0A1M7A711_9BACT|nr:leucine-rich repeat domain-containing protein [Chitinophaga jiangningensis]SHL38482.1 hypothetical protein SAMN05444266_103153 [Chitinophaga jiangningensis]